MRPYLATDRERVRFVCFQTGFLGQPIAWQWRDSASFADMFSGYYTDEEPESASVVEVDGVVAGYLLGCVDTRRAWAPEAVAARHVLRRGLLVRAGTAGVLWRAVADEVPERARHLLRGRNGSGPGRNAPEVDLARWPAHLHIDLLPEARGQGAGRLLIDGWLDRLRGDGVAGCHLHTFAENSSAIAFFASVGFEQLGGPVRVPGLRDRGGLRLHTQAMVLDL